MDNCPSSDHNPRVCGIGIPDSATLKPPGHPVGPNQTKGTR
ncbi:hypothetical protein BIFDEN_00596 [Bifidobacterium dentium ATCC 27678]|nr:hypothetical protein BIFDEN_00596 [Bifidobacterium dentium ATCC 27678]